MGHIYSEAAEELLDKTLSVHERGFIRLVDYMGGDQSITQAARVSYGAGTKTIREDSGLIRYLLRHDHTTPFEMVTLKFHIKAPIFVIRQWIRHRTASVNEESARYSILKEEFHVPLPEEINFQSKDNKQGRGEAFDVLQATDIANTMAEHFDASYTLYEDLLGRGLAKETAREVLPLSIYTELYWQMNLHNLLHFLRLRLDPHAQKEIRDYANRIAECVKAVAPVAWAAFEDYKQASLTFSAQEQPILAHYFRTGDLVRPDSMSKGEYAELQEKVRRFDD